MPYLGDTDGVEAARENARDCHDVREVVEAVHLELIGGTRASHVAIYSPRACQVRQFTLCVCFFFSLSEFFPRRWVVVWRDKIEGFSVSRSLVS